MIKTHDSSQFESPLAVMYRLTRIPEKAMPLALYHGSESKIGVIVLKSASALWFRHNHGIPRCTRRRQPRGQRGRINYLTVLRNRERRPRP